MPQFDDNHVKLFGGIIVWDGITKPGTNTVGKNAGQLRYTLKCVFEPNNPDLGFLNELATKALNQSQWKGVLPQGARWAISPTNPGEFDDRFPGWSCVNFITNQPPRVFDANGAELQPMQYGPMIYTGQRVDVLCHCYDYDQAGNRGIAAGLDGFEPVIAANAERISIGGSGVNAAAAFGGGQQQQTYQPQGGQPAGGGQPAYQPQGGQPAGGGQPAYQPPGGQPAGGGQPAYQPPGGQPAGGGQPAYQPPGGQPAGGGQPAYQPPGGGQNHNYLPPGGGQQ